MATCCAPPSFLAHLPLSAALPIVFRSALPDRCRCIAALAVASLVCGHSAADEKISYSRQIQPLLAARCFACHGPDDAESGLALHEEKLAHAEPDSGTMAIVPGRPDESELLRRVATDDEWERMPPEGEPLKPAEIELLRKWIAQGGEYEKHWAFERPQRADPPEVQNTDWVANPIDAFVLAKLEAAGLEPAPPADRRVLARRVYYDLTGLPPTLAELEEFLNDDRPDAYEQLVDKLLASPRYGEKWARHWLDLVRYAESNSFERDSPKPYVWKYRDYVIRSLNEDKPYDQFVREQLAGDELEEVTTETMTATGYYRLGTWDDEPADPLQARYDDLDNIVSTTGQAFLGLTVGCARCHDHKIDPMPQTDYYSLLSFFADVTPYGEPRGRDPRFNSLRDCSPPETAKRRQEIEARSVAVRERMTEIEEAAIDRMSSADQHRSETNERRALLREKLDEYQTDAEREEYTVLRGERRDLRAAQRKLPPAELVLSLARCDARPEPTTVMMRGNPHVPGEVVAPAFPELFDDQCPDIPEAAADAHSAGRRRVLADWIASPDNMLTGRVIANRVWQHHFGRGIVRSSSNFGLLGTPPTHKELLDWLSFYLIDHEWRLKSLHRLILTSNTYQMSSTARPEALAADPANDLFWRFDMRRLTAEELRDTVLYVSGQLNEKQFGPSIYPKLSAEVLATQSQPGKDWNTSNAREASRRSIYIHVKRSLIVPELAVFDFPETDTSCEARFNTTQAAQALNLLHGEFMQAQARQLASRVERDAGGDVEGQIRHALHLALGREADDQTVADSLTLYDNYRSKHGLGEQQAFEQVCLMVLNLNELVFVD